MLEQCGGVVEGGGGSRTTAVTGRWKSNRGRGGGGVLAVTKRLEGTLWRPGQPHSEFGVGRGGGVNEGGRG